MHVLGLPFTSVTGALKHGEYVRWSVLADEVLAKLHAAAAAAAVATTSAHAEAASPATPPRAPAPPCGTMCDAAPWVRGLAAGVGVAEVLSAAALEKQAHAFLGADHMVRGGNAW